MKKLTFAAFVMMAVAVIGTSCTKTATTPAEAGKGNITLNMRLNTNEGNDTLKNRPTGVYNVPIPGNGKDYENNFPTGYMVQFVIDSKDLQENPDANYTYDKLVYTAPVVNGQVMIDLPASRIPHNVEVKYPELQLDRTWRIGTYGSLSNPRRDTSYTKIWTRATETISIWEGATIVRDAGEYGY